MRFDIADLRLFEAVCRSGSITGGASVAALAVASASRRIAEMERDLGRLLLSRGRDGVRPTEDGRALLAHAERLLGQWRDMAEELGMRGVVVRLPLRLAVNTGAAAGLLPVRLPGFLAANPDIAVELHEMSSDRVAAAVIAGAADLGIGLPGGANAPALEVVPMATDRIVLVLPSGHPMAGPGPVPLAEVAALPFVALPADRPLQRYVDQHVAAAGIRSAVRVRLPDVAALCRLVQAGAGAALLPYAAVLASGAAVVPRALAEAWADRLLALFRPRNRRPAAGTDRMAAYLLAAAREDREAITAP